MIDIEKIDATLNPKEELNCVVLDVYIRISIVSRLATFEHYVRPSFFSYPNKIDT